MDHPFADLIGLTLDQQGSGSSTFSLSVDDQHLNPHGVVHGAVLYAMADKTSLLDLNERICRWPLGHPGEADFHFCGVPVNPGFPYCVEHCGRAYQAQLPRGVRRPPPPMPFGGPRVR